MPLPVFHTAGAHDYEVLPSFFHPEILFTCLSFVEISASLPNVSFVVYDCSSFSFFFFNTHTHIQHKLTKNTIHVAEQHYTTDISAEDITETGGY